MLSEDGTLFIEVPDWTFYDDHVDPYIFEHLSQFNTFALSCLFSRVGMSIIALENSICAVDPATPNRVARLLLRRNNSLPSQTKNLTELFNSFSITHHSSWLRKLDHLLITSDFDSVALYPASHLTFDALLNSTLKKSNVIGLFDVDPKKADQVHLGLQVYPASDLIKYAQM